MTVVPYQPVFRFAPSPTGALHLGHARSALVGARLAVARRGRFLLRIEDIDTTRLRAEFIDWIFEDLAWLGLTWEQPVLRQSTAFDVYDQAAARLSAMGLLYPCFATRSEIADAGDASKTDPDGAPLYPGLWRGRSRDDVAVARAAGLPAALRLDMARAGEVARVKLQGQPLTFCAFDAADRLTTHACAPERWGDAIIVRKETPTSYHLSVVVDDARQGITHVTRGADLLAATDLHRLLQVLLDLPAPLYHHHPLITDATGRKLSKSAGDTSLRALKAAGFSADAIIAMAMGDQG